MFRAIQHGPKPHKDSEMWSMAEPLFIMMDDLKDWLALPAMLAVVMSKALNVSKSRDESPIFLTVLLLESTDG